VVPGTGNLGDAAAAVAATAASAFALAGRIRAGALSARGVVRAHIDRIRLVNPAINALVAERFAAALEEAAAVDRAVGDGAPLGPLAGVPFSVKEMIDVAGMPSTFGSLGRSGLRAARDATVVERLRAAGAIPLGVTNVPEWGMWFETDNLVYGRTSNPHDVRRGAGGSSGGEAALLAAGGSAFGVGSDIGGSVRIPAALCGVVAHKPSPGLLPLTGHHPVCAASAPATGMRAPYLVIGPLVRTAADLLPLLEIMAGPDGIDPNARATVPSLAALGVAAPIDWRGRRVLVLEDPQIRMAARPTAEVRGAVLDAAARLRDAGAELVPAPRDMFAEAVDLWAAALRSANAATLAEHAGLSERGALARALASTARGRAEVSGPLLWFLAGEALAGFRLGNLDVLMDRLVALAGRFDALVGADGVLLAPAHPRTAPLHRAPFRRPFDFAYTAVFNALRVPATVVPVGRGAFGLPLAVQVAARRGNDRLTIAAAQRIEAADAGFRPVTPRAR
jgi:fatty acid amide hydrolase 2